MITGVAILSDDGSMWALPAPARHGRLFSLAAFQGVDPHPCKQGFITDEGVFVDRECARRIADSAGQLKPNARSGPLLYSEDVW